MLCRDLWCFLGSARAYGGEAPCGEGEGFATQPTGRVLFKNKTNLFLCVYPDHSSNERTCTPKVSTHMLSQGYRVFSGSWKLVLIALTAGVMWDGLACLPFTRAQELLGSRWHPEWYLCSHPIAEVTWAMCCEVLHVSGFILYLGVVTLQKDQLYPCGQQSEKGLCQLICAAASSIKTILHCHPFFPLAVQWSTPQNAFGKTLNYRILAKMCQTSWELNKQLLWEAKLEQFALQLLQWRIICL